MVEIADLKVKYEEMRMLRNVPRGEDPPRLRLAALASKFPGALRELDDLPLGEIERRIDALSRAERDPAATVAWMTAMARFHVLARGALFAKRPTVSRREEWPDEARLWLDDLARVARPPRGRLMDLVYERLARELDTTPARAKELVFGKSRRTR